MYPDVIAKMANKAMLEEGTTEGFERHNVAESKSWLERGSKWEAEIENDWEVDGKWM